MTPAVSIAAALRARHLELALWLLATVVYGSIAGVLLQAQPRIAAAAMVAVWLAGAGLLVARDWQRRSRPAPR
jgi:hypothetical protein